MRRENERKPLVKNIYTADPSAHVYNGKIYIYPSHDVERDVPDDDNGDQYMMEDYHVLSMDDLDSECIDNGLALHQDDVPWVKNQMWAPDSICVNDKYYLTLNDANSCAYVTYKKGDKDIFTFSTGYETAGLGCSKSAGADSETAEICSSFGDISGSSDSVCAPMPDPWEDRHECTDEQRVKPACDTANGYIDTYQFVETSCSWIGTCTKNPNWCDGQTRACTNDAGRACTQSCTGVSWGACNINCDMSECAEGEEGSFGNCPGICKSDRSGFECKVGANNGNYWCESATSCKPLYKQCLNGAVQKQTCDDGDNYITRTYDLYKGWVGANSEDCNSGFDTANCKCA